MTITIGPKAETLLKEQAARAGQDIDSLADRLLVELLEAEARDYEEMCAGVIEGLADVEAGRVTPLEKVVADVQERRGQGTELFFAHQRWHKGVPVAWDRKYLLRTDVIYVSQKVSMLL